MVRVSEVLKELDGNGFSQEALLEILDQLMLFVDLRDSMYPSLKSVFVKDEIDEILKNIERDDFHKNIIHRINSLLSEREKECYYLHLLEDKSFAAIAKELGVSRSMVQQSIRRAKKKIEEIKRTEIAALNTANTIQ